MKEFQRKSFDTPQQLADYYSQQDATRGMILAELKKHFDLTNEEADWHLARAQFKDSVRARGKGLQETILGSVIVVAVAILASIVTAQMMAAGYFPGLPLWAVTGGVMLFGLVMAFRGAMKLFSGTDVE